MRLIDAEELVEYFDPSDFDNFDPCENYDNVIRIVNSAPTIDAKPVVRGKWGISYGDYDYFECSACGGVYYNSCDCTADAKEAIKNGNTYPYCPHCGAKMDLMENN